MRMPPSGRRSMRSRPGRRVTSTRRLGPVTPPFIRSSRLVPAARDAFDREDVGAVVAERQRQARIDPSAVDQDRTGAALAAVTSLLGSCEMETLTQEVEHRDARVSQLDVPSHPVNGEADGEVHAVLRSMLWSNCIAAAGI